MLSIFNLLVSVVFFSKVLFDRVSISFLVFFRRPCFLLTDSGLYHKFVFNQPDGLTL